MFIVVGWDMELLPKFTKSELEKKFHIPTYSIHYTTKKGALSSPF
jgi:hypothetical protein